ncbi:MAG: HlyD family efflux transporter periplasmic adaptor subunit [Burkholderiaceae bacterium]|nr:HlyD family efflux transporter periplasmic adaptor subunit [Burkholderiaceae bacterium]
MTTVTPLRACSHACTILAMAMLAACAPQDESILSPAEAAASAPEARFVAIARGRVDVPGGLLSVASPQGGLIQNWSVQPGDVVRKGQVLAQIDARETRHLLEQAKAEQGLAAAQLDALRARVPAARARLERLQQAQAAGAGSGQAVDDARAVLSDAEKQLVVQRSALAVVQQRVAQANQMLAAATIRAPVAGRVVQRTTQVGEYIAAYGVLLSLLPEGPRIVRADLNESLIARVKVGMRAEVVSVAEGGAVNGARVLSIGDVFGPPRSVDTADSEVILDARVVECLLQLDSSELRVGQRVLVRFLPADAVK